MIRPPPRSHTQETPRKSSPVWRQRYMPAWNRLRISMTCHKGCIWMLPIVHNGMRPVANWLLWRNVFG
eukprot:scaffold524948_cov15-Prasinocladus_malaysianus.AAC.1